MKEPVVVSWDELEAVEVRPRILAGTIRSDQLTVTLYRYGPGSEWEEHSHPEDQVTAVVAGGEIAFSIEGREIRLAPGQLALIPGGVPHSARAGDAEVVTLNVWPPRSSDRA